MPKPDLEFAVRSIETSSISLGRQWADSKRQPMARAKLQEALANHQRTLGRLMRQRPLQELKLVLAVSGEIGKLQQAGQKPDFGPNSQSWILASKQWQALHGQAMAGLETQTKNESPDAAAIRKSFGLALLTGAIALFFDEKAQRLSALMADGKHKAALSTLTMEQMV